MKSHSISVLSRSLSNLFHEPINVVTVALLGLSVMGGLVLSCTLIKENFFPAQASPLHQVGAARMEMKDLERQKVDPKKVLDSDPVKVADKELDQAVESVIREIHLFFKSARNNSPEFAEAVLGWGGKMRLVADHTPFMRDDRFEMYIQNQFKKYIFSEETLGKMLHDASVEFETQVDGIENEMLRDLDDIFPELFSDTKMAFDDNQALFARYRKVLKQVAASHRGTVGRECAVEVGSFLGGEIVGAIATRIILSCAASMGISAGTLTAGAAGAAYTFGVSLAVGILADWMFSFIWDKCADPKGTIAKKVNDSLTQMENLLINGDKRTPGLKKQLKTSIQKYTKCRNQALCTMALQGK